MNKKRILLYTTALFLFFMGTGCRNKEKNMTSEQQYKTDNTSNMEIKTAAEKAIATWQAEGIRGIQFLKTSTWKIDDEVFVNSTNDRAYLLLLTQDQDTAAELDYVQVLYAAKVDGSWNVYLQSLPNLVVPRKKADGKFQASSLEELSAVGRKQFSGQYKNSKGVINDEFINQEYNDDLKRNHERFLSKKINNQ